MPKRLFVALLLSCILTLAHRAVAIDPYNLMSCLGDCNGNDRVTSDELLQGIGLIFGKEEANSCPTYFKEGATSLTVADLIAAVNNATTATCETLRREAAKRDRIFGTAVEAGYLNIPDYSRILAKHFSSVTVENRWKPIFIQPQRGVFVYDGIDPVINYSFTNHMELNDAGGLVVCDNLPLWMTSQRGDADEIDRIIHEHITGSMQRYCPYVRSWEVANEVLDSDGSLKPCLWLALGESYVVEAFQIAHSICPDATLVINDFGVEDMNAKSDALVAKVQEITMAIAIDICGHSSCLSELNAEAKSKLLARVHVGVGLQFHVAVGDWLRYASLKANMRRLAEIPGVEEVQITELDVRIPLFRGMTPTAAQLVAQGEMYRNIVQLCLDEPKCRIVTMWGFTDGYSWINGNPLFPNSGAATIFNEEFEPKPAYWDVLGLFEGQALGH